MVSTRDRQRKQNKKTSCYVDHIDLISDRSSHKISNMFYVITMI